VVRDRRVVSAASRPPDAVTVALQSGGPL